MTRRNVTTKQQLLDMLHGRSPTEEEIQQEVDMKNLEQLRQLHKAVGERIAMVEQAHEDQQPDHVHQFVVGMLDIDLHKEIRCVEKIIKEKHNQHDMLYNTYKQMERRESFKEERRRCLVETLGSTDAAVIIGAMEGNQQQREKDQQRKELKKKISITCPISP